MSVYTKGVEVACDGPDEQTDCPKSNAVRACFTSMTATQVRADGRADGWTTRRRAGRLRDLCPICRAVSHEERGGGVPGPGTWPRILEARVTDQRVLTEYGRAVNAPLSRETVEAIRQRLADGTAPRRRLVRRDAQPTDSTTGPDRGDLTPMPSPCTSDDLHATHPGCPGTPQPARGQIWADNDRRSSGRYLLVVAVDATAVTMRPVAWSPAQQIAAELPGARTTTIRRSRLRPTSTGYRYVGTTKEFS